MQLLTNFFAGVLSPVLSPVSRWLLSNKRSRPTWHYETAVVGALLIVVALFTSPGITSAINDIRVLREFLIIWLSAGAVLGTFLHAKVGYRMSEALELEDAPTTSCYHHAERYWVWKEVLWFAVFLLSGAYPALVGVVVFILYPAWRKIHVRERKVIRN